MKSYKKKVTGRREVYWQLQFAGISKSEIDKFNHDDLYEAYAAYQKMNKKMKGGR